MRHLTRDNILIVTFVLIIFLPILLSFFIPQQRVSYAENRLKTPFPVFNVSNFEKREGYKGKLIAVYREAFRFKSGLDAYFKENFALRDQYLSLFSNYKFWLFNTSPYPARVALGKDGWMFLGNNSNNCIFKSYGLKQFSESELETISKYLSETTRWARDNGISFYVAIAPEKQTVYPQYLPLIKSHRSLAEQLKESLNDTDVTVVDLKDGFPEDRSIRLYHKTDSHWNEFGAFCGARELFHTLQKDFPLLDPLKLDDYAIDSVSAYDMDLSRGLSLRIKETKILCRPKAPTETSQSDKHLTVPKNFFLDPKLYESRFENNHGNGKIIYFRDSFASQMLPFISSRFKESLFIWDYTIDKDLIRREKPDIVVLQVVERNLDRIVR